ncbi:tetratricopeptide repeat protein [Psychrobacter sp.]|uniref:tetratricopeptide repeat protein n=2 Tax=Psychrobacter sp. TaxID=56811 RepID=UPI0026499FFF|nr:tetratricopeptide repeat protein [Psychrobacter sp.]MDN6275012.1 tetratricopeptide repeat protein [Psychrobacter sp.]MDN6307133.1 tetratricopeptide repeat protein [Psychrobacter sp.]
MKQSISSEKATTAELKQLKSIKTIVAASAFLGIFSLSACQTVPSSPSEIATTTSQTTTPAPQDTPDSTQSAETSTTEPTTVTQIPTVRSTDDSRLPTENEESSNTYESSNPLTQDVPVWSPTLPEPEPIIVTPSREGYEYTPPEPAAPSRNDLLERARANSQQQTQQASSNNSNLPAFRNLMQRGVSQLKSGDLTNAETSFTRAQRLEPRSSAVYFYLAQVALKKNQPRKAEAMARRGLSVSRDTNRRQALWQVILRSGQAQGNSRVIKEAQQALQ